MRGRLREPVRGRNGEEALGGLAPEGSFSVASVLFRKFARILRGREAEGLEDLVGVRAQRGGRAADLGRCGLEAHRRSDSQAFPPFNGLFLVFSWISVGIGTPGGVRIGVLEETQVPEAVFCDGQSGFCTAAPAFCTGG